MRSTGSWSKKSSRIRFMLRRTFVIFALFAAFLQAAVTRVEVTEKVGFAEYERIAGKVYFAVDPKLAANRAIADIDLAPRNAAGLSSSPPTFWFCVPRIPLRAMARHFSRSPTGEALRSGVL